MSSTQLPEMQSVGASQPAPFGAGVRVEVTVAVCVGVDVGVAVGVDEAVRVGVDVGVSVSVKVAVELGVLVGVTEGESVGVRVGVTVGVSVGLLEGVSVGVLVGDAVGVSVGVSVGSSGNSHLSPMNPGGHMHTASPWTGMQVPPFSQGLGLHGLPCCAAAGAGSNVASRPTNSASGVASRFVISICLPATPVSWRSPRPDARTDSRADLDRKGTIAAAAR